jgi:integrase
VNQFFDWLAAEGLIPRNPTRRNGERVIPRPRQVPADDNPNVVTVTRNDVGLLIRAAERSDEWNERLAIHCLAYLGPRRRALAQARIGDYDMNARTLTFREKGGKAITKPVPDKLATLIDAAILDGVYGALDDYLIPSYGPQRRGGERDDRVIWRIVKNVADRAGVDAHVHSLRAAFAVHFLASKPGEVVALQKLMGHRRIDTTMVYLRRLDRDQAMESVRDLSWDEVPA